MPHSTNLALTFGIEIEFHAVVSPHYMIQLLTDLNRGYHHEREAVVYHLAGELQAAGIKVHFEDSVWMRVSKEDFSRWSLKVLGSHTQNRNDDGDWQVSLVLSSRVLSLDDMDYASDSHPPSRIYSGGIDEVRHVLKVLEKSTVGCVPKKHSGLHVHVGVGKPHKRAGKTPPSEPFSFDALSNLTCLVVALEPCINSLLEMHRGDSDYCKPASGIYQLAAKNAPQRLALIRDQISPWSLFELMNPDHSPNHALNFQHIPADGNYQRTSRTLLSGTVEFRQHQGTLCPDETSAWIQVIAGLVRTAHLASLPTKLPDWGVAAERGRFTYNNLLEKIGKPHLVPFYSTRIHRIRHVSTGNAIEPPTRYSDSSMGSTIVSLRRLPLPKVDGRARKAIMKSLRVLTCRPTERESSPESEDEGKGKGKEKEKGKDSRREKRR